MATLSERSSKRLWLFVMAISLLCLVFVMKLTWLGILSETWPIAQAVVIESRGVKNRLQSEESYTYGVRASYRYTVRGICYTNTVIKFTFSDGPRDDAQNMLKLLPEGRVIPARYAPWNPQVATLFSGIERKDLVPLALLSFIILMSWIGFKRGWRWHSRTRLQSPR